MNIHPRRVVSHSYQVLAVITVIITILLLVPSTIYADGPVVCLAGTGTLNPGSYNLANCGAPTDLPVYVVLRVKSGGYNVARSQISEGALACDVYAPVGSSAECAVTVRDGVVDQLQASNTESYSLSATWEAPQASAVNLMSSNVFTIPLTSGAALTIQRSFTWGEIATSSLLFFICCVIVLFLIVSLIVLRS